jgi:hypothetical protein
MAVAVAILLLVSAAGSYAIDPALASSAPSQVTPVSPGFDLGDRKVGTAVSSVVCGFAPASRVLLILDGRAGGTEATDRTGCATITVSFASTTQSRITQTSAEVTTSCGLGSLVAAGRGPSGVPVGQTYGFRILCPAARASGFDVFTDRLARWLIAFSVLVIMGGAAIIMNRRRQVILER